MMTKEGLIERLKKEGIEANILAFKIDKDEYDREFAWFAFSFEDGHTEWAYESGLDVDTESDALVYICGDDEDDYKEAINAIKFSRISPYKDGV